MWYLNWYNCRPTGNSHVNICDVEARTRASRPGPYLHPHRLPRPHTCQCARINGAAPMMCIVYCFHQRALILYVNAINFNCMPITHDMFFYYEARLRSQLRRQTFQAMAPTQLRAACLHVVWENILFCFSSFAISSCIQVLVGYMHRCASTDSRIIDRPVNLCTCHAGCATRKNACIFFSVHAFPSKMSKTLSCRSAWTTHELHA